MNTQDYKDLYGDDWDIYLEDDMREIKFRAWHKEFHKWVEFELYLLVNSGRVFHDDYGDLVDITDVIEISQYTGLKDKNGKEIYEGDIVIGFDPESNSEVKGKVYQSQDGAWRVYGIGALLFTLVNGEVIGNIYENPNLIIK